MPTCKKRLEHAAKIGFKPKVIVDGGAFNGKWSVETSSHFNQAQFICVEANPYLIDELRIHTSSIQPSPHIIQAALGEKSGTATFNIFRDVTSDTGASLLHHVTGDPETTVEVSLHKLDNLMNDLDLKPDLVKLDLQGGELSALKGAEISLKHAEMFIIEFGCLEAYVGRTTPKELINMMYDHQFVLYDVVDLGYRPYDGALTGGDFFFVKIDSPLRAYKGWK
jgi:FkbM family methyltransferase